MLEPIEIEGKYYVGQKTQFGFVISYGWEDLTSFGQNLKKLVDYYNEHRSEIASAFLEAFEKNGE